MGIEHTDPWPRGRVLLALAALSVLAYWRAQNLPFISDDYVQIKLARSYGPVSGWAALAADPLYRCRATSLVMTYWTEHLFGLDPLVYNLSSLLVHILNVWLVYALGAWSAVGWRVSALAAGFFAVYEGHQGAVMWYAALPELLVFFCSLISLLCWVLWLQSPARRPLWYAGSLAAFVLALASKESAVVVAALLVLVLWTARAGWRSLVYVVPFGVMAAAYFMLAYVNRSSHLFFHDGTFSLSAPFPLVLVNSTGRLFWFWGLLALVVLKFWGEPRSRFLPALSLAWIVITFLPYSFLTYMPRVPSRHTYFASVGLAFIVGAAFLELRRRWPNARRAAVVIAFVIVAHNCGYLWFKKHGQYLERAAPTEALIEFARKVNGPVYVHCFPYDMSVAEYAVSLRLKKAAVPLPSDRSMEAIRDKSAVFCWNHRDRS